jgi:hypothetical protein
LEYCPLQANEKEKNVIAAIAEDISLQENLLTS